MKEMKILTTEKYLKANELRLAFNSLAMDTNANEMAKATALNELNNALVELNEEVKETAFSEFLKAQKPVYEAIKKGFLNLYKAQITKDKETGLETCEFASKMYIIDLQEMADFATLQEKEVFHTNNWNLWCDATNNAFYEYFRNLLQMPESSKVDKMKISKLAKALNVESLESKTSATYALQNVLNMVLFEAKEDKKGKTVNTYKVDGRDLEALKAGYLKWSNRNINGMVFPSHQTFRTMLMRVFHRNITGGELTAE